MIVAYYGFNQYMASTIYSFNDVTI